MSKHVNNWVVFVLAFLLPGPLAVGDDLFTASGRKLKTNQRRYIENQFDSLRDSSYVKRFETIEYLIELKKIGIPLIKTQVKENSNPMVVRCALLALAEIGGKDAALVFQDVLKSSKSGRDEKVIAALGLGKQDQLIDFSQLRTLIDKGEDRMVRKAAALALARNRDKASVSSLLKLLKSEKEEELFTILALSASMIGGEELIKRTPKLIKQHKGPRRSALILGAGFLGDPVLLPCLLKYGPKDKDMQAVLSVILGRYTSPDAAEVLAKTALGSDGEAAQNAVYSLSYQDRDRAAKVYDSILNSSRPVSLKAQVLLAISDLDLVEAFADQIHLGLKDKDKQMRSAAVLALRNSKQGEDLIRLASLVKSEKEPQVVADMLMVLALLKGGQHLDNLSALVEKLSGDSLKTAQQAIKVISGKLDVRILKARLNQRLSDLSAKWEYRFRDAVQKEIFHGFALDRIMQRAPNGKKEEGPGPGPPPPGNDDPPPPPGGSFPEQDKKFLFRYEVVEWELLLWFENYPYFPASFFLQKSSK